MRGLGLVVSRSFGRNAPGFSRFVFFALALATRAGCLLPAAVNARVVACNCPVRFERPRSLHHNVTEIPEPRHAATPILETGRRLLFSSNGPHSMGLSTAVASVWSRPACLHSKCWSQSVGVFLFCGDLASRPRTISFFRNPAAATVWVWGELQSPITYRAVP